MFPKRVLISAPPKLSPRRSLTTGATVLAAVLCFLFLFQWQSSSNVTYSSIEIQYGQIFIKDNQLRQTEDLEANDGRSEQDIRNLDANNEHIEKGAGFGIVKDEFIIDNDEFGEEEFSAANEIDENLEDENHGFVKKPAEAKDAEKMPKPQEDFQDFDKELVDLLLLGNDYQDRLQQEMTDGKEEVSLQISGTEDTFPQEDIYPDTVTPSSKELSEKEPILNQSDNQLPQEIINSSTWLPNSQRLTQQDANSNETLETSHLPVRQDLLFFNRVHKTGSENFVAMMQYLARKNNFHHERCDYVPCHPDVKRVKESELLRQTDHFDTVNTHRPLTFDRHLYFYDFEEFGRPNPIWFSMVRDPIRKFESKFYYSRKLPTGYMYEKILRRGHEWINQTSKEKWRRKDLSECVLTKDPECDLSLGEIHDDLYLDLTIPYFCGQDLNCSVLGSEWAYQQAVENVEKWYPVVAILEDLPTSIAVLEKELPRFFKGFTKVYEIKLKSMKVNKGFHYPAMTPEANEVASQSLELEINFYEYLKQRLYRQFEEVRKGK